MKNYKLKIRDNFTISICYSKKEGDVDIFTTNVIYKDCYIDYDRYYRGLDDYDISFNLDNLRCCLFTDNYFDEEMRDEYLNFYCFGIEITPFEDAYAKIHLYLENGIDYINIILEKEEVEDFYYYLLLAYYNDSNNEKIMKLIDNKKIIDNNMYFIVTVTFYEGGKEYQYRSLDESIEEDEYVLVPVGESNELKIARVVNSDYYSIEDIEFDIEKMKWIKGKKEAE